MDTGSSVQHVPYAPPSSVVGVIQQLRNRGVPEPVTSSSLQVVGVSSGNAARTLQTLKFLGLVNDEGNITNTFKRLKQARTDEYPDTLAEVLRSTYHSVFDVVDPAEDDMTSIEDAFRLFEPSKQRGRMVTLFLGLCHEAGLVPEDRAPKMQSQSRQQRSTGQRTKRTTPPEKSRQPEQPPAEETQGGKAEETTRDYSLVRAVVGQLPTTGVWTQKRRDLWVQAMTSAVDLTVEIEEPEVVYEGEIMPELELENR